MIAGESQQQADLRWMSIAMTEARKALAANEIPIGAVVVDHDKVIGRGHNLTETLNDVTAHAEMMAITAAADTLGEIYARRHPLCDGRTLPDVCRSNRLESDKAHRDSRRRFQTWLHYIYQPLSFPPQSHGHHRSYGRGGSRFDETILCSPPLKLTIRPRSLKRVADCNHDNLAAPSDSTESLTPATELWSAVIASSIVEPVVITSSTTRICFPVSSSG